MVKPRVAKTYSIPEDPLFSSQWHLVSLAFYILYKKVPHTFFIMQVNSGQLGEKYSGRDLRVEQAWMQGLTGCNVTATIVDDGNPFPYTYTINCIKNPIATFLFLYPKV